MAIAAQRFNFLDRETHVGVKEFTELSDNGVYNVVDEVTSKALSDAQNTGMIDKLESGLDDLAKTIEGTNILVTESLKNAVDEAIDTISNMALPKVVKDALDSLKKLDLGGLKGFFKDVLRVGKRFLCNSLDFLKLFMLGFSLNKNILSGLIIALLLSWLDRICKGQTAEEMESYDPVEKMDAMHPPRGVDVTPDNAFSKYTRYVADQLKSAVTVTQTTWNRDLFLTNVFGGNVNSAINSARANEISHHERNTLVTDIESRLNLYPVTDARYSFGLDARAKLKDLPLISVERRDLNNRYEHSSNKFGSFIKNLADVRLQPVTFLSLSAVEQSLYKKLEELRDTSGKDLEIQRTPHNGFDNFNFDRFTNTITPEERAYLLTLDTPSDSHRLYDIHPTTNVFLEA